MIIAVIGAGVIGGAVAKCLRHENRIIATRRHVEKLKDLESMGIEVTSDNRVAANKAEIVILCVKPRDVKKVLEEIRGEVKGKLVVSMAAAVDTDFLEKTAPEARFVRAMPNIAISVHESFTAYCTSSKVTAEDKSKTENLLKVFGRVVEIDERHMDAITALSGCAPAYLSIIVEAMTYAGLEEGLPKDLALMASAQAMIGTGKLILEAQKAPSEIRDIVTTPGGVTLAGLRELEKVPVRHAVMNAIKAATAKSREISRVLMKEQT